MTQFQAFTEYDQDNIFAKILRGDAPSHRVYEDEWSLAFMDVMPQADGHTLVIPKDPTADIMTADPDVLARTIQTTQRIARAVRHAFDASGVMIMQLNGAKAGQSVFHLHFHVLPRSDGLDMRLHARDMADPEVLADHAKRVRDALAALT